MKTSLVERILTAFAIGIIMFAINSLFQKMVVKDSGWLIYSAVSSIAWALGHFVGRTVISYERRFWAIFLLDICIVFAVFYCYDFVFRMFMWETNGASFMAPFVVSLIINEV